jgi:hypothetical protein
MGRPRRASEKGVSATAQQAPDAPCGRRPLDAAEQFDTSDQPAAVEAAQTWQAADVAGGFFGSGRSTGAVTRIWGLRGHDVTLIAKCYALAAGPDPGEFSVRAGCALGRQDRSEHSEDDGNYPTQVG